MHLRQQIIEDRVEILAKNLGNSLDYAFLRFVHSLVTNRSVYTFDQTDLVDGGSDKQIDVITIENLDEKEANIYIIQAKNTTSFSSNSLIQMRNGLYWIFNALRADVNKLSNVKLRDKIFEVRSERNSLGPSNIHVNVAFITNGLTDNLSDEFLQEEQVIKQEYGNGTFASFDLKIWGADELVNQLNIIEKKDRKINANIRIRYDTNNPSLIKYHAEGLRGIICTAAATEIARIVNNDSTGSIFDSNIRRFLGTRGAVNADILKTCTEATDSYQFWFLNNGITIVCEDFDAVTDPDNPYIKLKNMQIVNGCQTATTLALAERNNQLVQDTRVLLRIYEAPSAELVDKIVLTTNNQNKINSRDLKANDPIQIDMEQAFKAYNYFYERKPHQYDSLTDLDPKRILPNEIVAQCYLAVVLKKPVDARTSKQKVWGDLYNSIFTSGLIEPYIMAVLIYHSTQEWIKQSGYISDPNDVRRKLASNGTFFIARITSYLWRRGDAYNIKRSLLQQQIAVLENDPHVLDPYISEAFDLLEAVIRQNYDPSDLDKILKSTTLNDEIDRALYSGSRPPSSSKPLLNTPNATSVSASSPTFYLSISVGGKVAFAEAREANREFIVLKGSKARKEDKRSLRQTQKAQREQLRLDGKLLKEGEGIFLVFTEDVSFSTPSAAASIVAGAQLNGYISWKVKGKGQTYRAWLQQNQAKDANSDDQNTSQSLNTKLFPD